MYRFLLPICCLLLFHPVYSQSGQLDYSFGDSGVVSFGDIYGISLNPDGSIILTDNAGFQIHKLKQDGTIDSTFGINGVSAPMSGESYFTVLQTDGKIIQAGYEGDTKLTCHLPNGTLDSSFGNNGSMFLPDGISCGHAKSALGIQADDKILYCGAATSANGGSSLMVIIRLHPNGSVDSTFNGTGYQYVDLPFTFDVGTGIAELPNGKLIVTGYSFAISYPDVVNAIRLDSNGEIDSTFGINGIFSLNTGYYDYGTGMKVQPDGKIVLIGYATEQFPYFKGKVVRCDINGKVDSTFGSDGLVTLTTSILWDIDIQVDGKILLAGLFASKGVLERLLPNGEPDLSFYDDGVFNWDSSGVFRNVVVQPDGKIIAAGNPVIRLLNDLITGPCQSDFYLYPDTFELHKYWAVDEATGTQPMTYIWSWGDGTYDTLQYPSHTYDTAGFYTICLTIFDSLGCVNNFCNSFDLLKMSSANKENGMIQVNVVSDIPVNSPAEQVSANELTIFPNPATNNIHLRFNELIKDENLTVSLINHLGKVVYQQKMEVQQPTATVTCMPGSELPAGYYLVNVQAPKLFLVAPVIFSH